MNASHRKIEFAALTIAGSDSCGGAGIQADLATFQDLGVFGASVVTAVTAQNTVAVHASEAISAEIINAQLNAVLDDLPIRAIKTGMLPDARSIETISATLERRCRDIPLIVDPVLVATSGGSLTTEDTVAALKQQLFPLATLITPNLDEAAALTATSSGHPDDMAQELLSSGCKAVLLKGGHGVSETITDLLLMDNGSYRFEHPARAGEFHGTGCVLSSAITANLARGAGLKDAVESGINYVQTAISKARLPLEGKLHIIT